MIRFSIVVPCLGASEILAATLESLAAQDFDSMRVQAIVVDDASEPDLRKTVCSFGERWAGEAIYLRNTNNLGRAASRNRGISAASGEILVFMDMDQILEPDFLSRLDEGFGNDLDQSIRANTSVWPPLLKQSAFLRYYNSRFLGQRSPAELKQVDLNDLPPKYYATTCMATGRTAVLAIGGFDESFRRYGCEDEDLGFRLHQAGIPLRFSSEAKSYSSDGSLTIERACRRLIDYAGISVALMLKKHPEYSEQMALGFLERNRNSRNASNLARVALFGAYCPLLSEFLLSYLKRSDGKQNFDPPSKLYQATLLGFYLRGLRSRGRGST